MISIRAWIRGGDEVGSPGLSALTGQLLVEGTSTRDWLRLSRAVEKRGASLSGFGGHEAHGVQVDALAADLEWSLDLLAEVLETSAFAADRFDHQREQMLAEIESRKDRAEVLVAEALDGGLYGDHPAGQPSLGTPETLARLSATACRSHHHQGRDRGWILSAAGDFDVDSVLTSLRALLPTPGAEAVASAGSSPGSSPGSIEGASASRSEPVVVRPGERQEIEVPGLQAHLLLGQLSLTRLDPRLPALLIAGVALGAGPGLHGRVPDALREKEGLAYDTSIEVAAGAGSTPGRLVLHAAVAPDNVPRAESILRAALARALGDGLTPEEIAEARAYLLGSQAFGRETARQWSGLLAVSEFYGLPYDDRKWVRERLLAPSVDEINRVLAEVLDLESLHTVVGLPTHDSFSENPDD